MSSWWSIVCGTRDIRFKYSCIDAVQYHTEDDGIHYTVRAANRLTQLVITQSASDDFISNFNAYLVGKKYYEYANNGVTSIIVLEHTAQLIKNSTEIFFYSCVGTYFSLAFDTENEADSVFDTVNTILTS